ncbi:helix-turn-helix domain-containing protein [Halomarina pelagica]|uniref:helix-turn-helix domain-containing protein n=1 Tax=Halomarina pelagica TaxID=2961599 RepID=UPI0020C4EDE2|nr:helix-turn-helix domain-containing protein [Halomarina sp. BND7]
MDHLDDVSTAALRQALDELDDSRPARRLFAAIAYKHGVTQTELAEWFDVERRTIYSWLTRLEADAESLDRVVYDAHRSGRPRKLTDDQCRELRRTLRESPEAAGYDAPAWTPALVRDHVRDRFDVDYSIPSCRRLMKEAGLRYRRTKRGDTRWMPP